MSKFTDRLLAQALFDKEPKVTKVKKEITLKDYMKFEKELEEFKEWKKAKEPKKEDKKDPKGWEKLSVFQKFAILWVTVPMLLFLQFSVMLKMAVILGLVKTW